MQAKPLRDQRGISMVLELVLVAAVLSLAGLAVYQANQRSKTAAVRTTPTPASTTAAGLATSAAAIATQESATDVDLSTTAETSADELSDMDADVANLGGTADASF